MGRTVLRFDFDYDFYLLGLVSPVSDYRLCWTLNKDNIYNFKRSQDIEISSRKQKKLIFFSVYHSNSELDKIDYYLISNKLTGEYLIPEIDEADFFLMVKGNFTSQQQDSIMDQIRSNSIIQAVFEVSAAELKSKQNLIFE